MERERQKCCALAAKVFGNSIFPIEASFLGVIRPSLLLAVNQTKLLDRDEVFGYRVVLVLQEISNELTGQQKVISETHNNCFYTIFMKFK